MTKAIFVAKALSNLQKLFSLEKESLKSVVNLPTL